MGGGRTPTAANEPESSRIQLNRTQFSNTAHPEGRRNIADGKETSFIGDRRMRLHGKSYGGNLAQGWP